MQDTEMPALEELAGLLQAAGGGEHHPGAGDTARWLIDQSPEASELYAELVAKPGDEPSLMEIARLLSAVTSSSPMPESLETAHWLIAQSLPATACLDRLEQLRADAGTAPRIWDWTAVLDYERQLNRLLEAADDWQDPGDVLDPTRSRGLNCQVLYNLCRARVERSTGAERRRLAAVLEKLERPAELQRLLPFQTGRFERLKKWLQEVSDLGSAVDSLEEMARLLRSALESPAPG